jgi:carboxyl-terminal processing protease
MSKPWRDLAIALFLSSVLVGGLAGDQLVALSRDSDTNLKTYTELLMLAHQQYGTEITYRELVYSSIRGMLRTLDPHTNFLTPEAYDDMRERQQGSFFGLGILISRRDGQLTVISPIEGSPAWRLGLRAGDVISTIEGEPTEAMTLNEAVNKLKGPKDTQVNINIVRRGLPEPLEVSITRAEIPQTTVRYAYMMAPEVGYIRLTDFSRSSNREMTDAVDRLQAEGMEKLILDLRGNGGGLLDQTVKISNLFVPEKSSIVETRGRISSSHQAFVSDGEREPLEMPLIVLVDQGSASAAEILAGAIQDHDVGLVVGTPTWGKGLVQTVYNLSYGTGLALTTAKYYTPSGRLIQRDYSSYYDYYTYFNEEAEEDSEEDTPKVQLEDSPAFSTDIGRSVFGGGGITPDVVVELPNGPVELQPLYVKNAFFNFAVEFHNKSEIKDPSWQPPEDMIDQFDEWLQKEEIATEEELDEIFENPEAVEFSRRQIHSSVMTAAFGTEAAHRVLAVGDLQIQRALELFGDAGALLAERIELDGNAPPRLPTRILDREQGGVRVESSEGDGDLP